MQIDASLNNSSQARGMAEQAIPLSEMGAMDNDSKRRRGEILAAQRKEPAFCGDPECKFPNTPLANQNQCLALIDKKRVRICFSCQRRRQKNFVNSLLEEPKGMPRFKEIMKSARNASKMLGHYPTTGAKVRPDYAKPNGNNQKSKT